MGADFADIDRDGHDDLFVVDMQSQQHPLRLTQKGVIRSQPRIPGDIRSRFKIGIIPDPRDGGRGIVRCDGHDRSGAEDGRLAGAI